MVLSKGVKLQALRAGLLESEDRKGVERKKVIFPILKQTAVIQTLQSHFIWMVHSQKLNGHPTCCTVHSLDAAS